MRLLRNVTCPHRSLPLWVRWSSVTPGPTCGGGGGGGGGGGDVASAAPPDGATPARARSRWLPRSLRAHKTPPRARQPAAPTCGGASPDPRGAARSIVGDVLREARDDPRQCLTLLQSSLAEGAVPAASDVSRAVDCLLTHAWLHERGGGTEAQAPPWLPAQQWAGVWANYWLLHWCNLASRSQTGQEGRVLWERIWALAEAMQTSGVPVLWHSMVHRMATADVLVTAVRALIQWLRKPRNAAAAAIGARSSQNGRDVKDEVDREEEEEEEEEEREREREGRDEAHDATSNAWIHSSDTSEAHAIRVAASVTSSVKPDLEWAPFATLLDALTSRRRHAGNARCDAASAALVACVPLSLRMHDNLIGHTLQHALARINDLRHERSDARNVSSVAWSSAWREVTHCLAQLRDRGRAPSSSHAVALMRLLTQKAEDWPHASALLRSLGEAGVPVTASLLLHTWHGAAVARLPRDEMMRLWRWMLDVAKPVPQHSMWNSVCHAFACAEEGPQWDLLADALQHMRHLGLAPTVTTFSTLLSAVLERDSPLGRQGLRFVRSVEQSAGLSVHDQAVLLSVLVEHWHSHNALQPALALWGHLLAHEQPVTQPALVSALVRIFARHDHAACFQVFQQAVNNGSKPEPECVGNLIIFLLHRDRISQALALLRTYVKSGSIPSVRTFAIIMSTALHNGSVKLAVQLMGLMSELDRVPNGRLFHLVLSPLCHQDKWQDVLAVRGIMREHRVVPLERTYTMLLYHALRLRHVHDAQLLVEEMDAQGVLPLCAPHLQDMSRLRALKGTRAGRLLQQELLRLGNDEFTSTSVAALQ